MMGTTLPKSSLGGSVARGALKKVCPSDPTCEMRVRGGGKGASARKLFTFVTSRSGESGTHTSLGTSPVAP